MWRYISTLSLTPALDGDAWSTLHSGHFTSGKDRTPTGWMCPRAILDFAEDLAPPPPGFDPRTVEPLASRYTVYAIVVHIH